MAVIEKSDLATEVYKLTLPVLFILYRALTLSSPEVRFHMDSETHDPIDLQTKELKYVLCILVEVPSSLNSLGSRFYEI